MSFGDETMHPDTKADLEKDLYIRRLETAFLDASRFIPTDRTIELNADTNRIAVEILEKRKLDKGERKT